MNVCLCVCVISSQHTQLLYHITDTVNHAHAQLSRLLLGYSECCTSDQRNELNRWVKRASTLWSTIEDRSKDERTARVYADLLLKNSL